MNLPMVEIKIEVLEEVLKMVDAKIETVDAEDSAAENTVEAGNSAAVAETTDEILFPFSPKLLNGPKWSTVMCVQFRADLALKSARDFVSLNVFSPKLLNGPKWSTISASCR